MVQKRQILENLNVPLSVLAIKQLRNRNEAIILLWSSGILVYEEIGLLFGITRERVRQVIERYEKKMGEIHRSTFLSFQAAREVSGLPKSVLREAIKSGKLRSSQNSRGKHFIQPEDLQVFMKNIPVRSCPVCGKTVSQNRKYCSVQCQRRSYYRERRGKFVSTNNAKPKSRLSNFPRLSEETEKGLLAEDKLITLGEAAKIAKVTKPSIGRLIDLGLFSIVHGIMPKQPYRGGQALVRFIPLRQVLAYREEHDRLRSKRKGLSQS